MNGKGISQLSKNWWGDNKLEDFDTIQCRCSKEVKPTKLLKKGVKYVCECKRSWVIDPDGDLKDYKIPKSLQTFGSCNYW